MKIKLKNYKFTIILVGVFAVLIIIFITGKKFEDFVNFERTLPVNMINKTEKVEKKLEIGGKDLRLKSFEIDGSTVTMLIDYTPVPHIPRDTDVIKVESIPQQNVIKSWIHTVKVNPKIFLSADQRFLVFEFGDISIYNFDEKKLINSLEIKIPQIEGTNVVRLENGFVKLGLFEGRGGICDENAFSVNLDTLDVRQLQPKSAMERC